MPRAAPTNSSSPIPSLMPAFLARFRADRNLLASRFGASFSETRRKRLLAFLAEWEGAANALRFEAMNRSDRLDWLLFNNYLRNSANQTERDRARFLEVEPLVPFATSLIALEDERRARFEPDPKATAETLTAACLAARDLERRIVNGEARFAPAVALRASRVLDEIAAALPAWRQFYAGYDPEFVWWNETPYRDLTATLETYSATLKQNLANAGDPDAIAGDPVGPEIVTALLTEALVPHTPVELIRIAQTEREWCLDQLRKASADMGFRDEWRAALERVKEDHVPPGRQPALVRALAEEAADFVERHDLLTVPPLLRECWQMEMMPAEKQKINPFFLGGETIVVSYPTNEMDHTFKRMCLRGNNRYFTRATVQHELIPGHAMQAYAEPRNQPYRALFETPFWTEGWTLHWEMLLWDLGFPQTPEERIGMLFWRLHRCVRVEFSLRFHLGEISPMECVEMLTEQVGHERENALGEVRRSFGGDYDPLYQCAYLIGGLQVRALHREMTGTGKMSQKQFHDRFLEEGSMPIAALRALLSDWPLRRETNLAKFAPTLESERLNATV